MASVAGAIVPLVAGSLEEMDTAVDIAGKDLGANLRRSARPGRPARALARTGPATDVTYGARPRPWTGHAPVKWGHVAHHSHSSKPSGGDHHAADARRVVCAVITVSDTRTPETDTSGKEIRARLETAGCSIASASILPDEPALVRRTLQQLAEAGQVDVVLLSGGTGIAARDTTYEAVASLLTKRIDGFGELFRALSFEEIGAAAMLSRAAAGLIGTMAVFSMPGSTAACRLAMDRLIVPQLAHVVGLARPSANKDPAR